jgi:hypothetical protein
MLAPILSRKSLPLKRRQGWVTRPRSNEKTSDKKKKNCLVTIQPSSWRALDKQAAVMSNLAEMRMITIIRRKPPLA